MASPDRGAGPVTSAACKVNLNAGQQGMSMALCPAEAAYRAWLSDCSVCIHSADFEDCVGHPVCESHGALMRTTALMEPDRALSGRHGNMVDMGIVDPLRVVRSALANGASVAGLLLTTNTLVAEEQTPWGGSAALMTEYGSLDEGLHQPSPDSSTPQSLGLGPSVG